jgi:HEPN domain-containing protein
MSAPLSRADLRALAKARCEDAQFLLADGRWSSAYYLSGYAVELALKARIASLFLSDAIPDKAFVHEVYTHNLNNLLKAAGLQAELTALQKTRPDLYANWGIAGGWSESSRYALWDSVAAHTLVGAIADPNDGVFTWLTQYW